MASRVFTSPPIRVRTGSRGRGFRRADIVFEGLDLAGPPFEARVFVNNPAADEHTALTPENGYAGSFYVYAYGVPPPGLTAEDTPPGGARTPRAPITKSLEATEAIRAALAQGDEVTVTVVVVPHGGSEAGLDLGRVSIVLDPSAPSNDQPPGQ